MSNNRELRESVKSLDMFLALSREGTAKDKRCMRQIIRDYPTDLAILETRCNLVGGEWRIHQTVNPRDPMKAAKYLMKKLIDYPEICQNLEVEWRTALLQKTSIFEEQRFMLDIDTKCNGGIDLVLMNYDTGKIEKIESPKGWHYLTKPFDTREVCALPDVTLQRDGYFYVKTCEATP